MWSAVTAIVRGIVYSIFRWLKWKKLEEKANKADALEAEKKASVAVTEVERKIDQKQDAVPDPNSRKYDGSLNFDEWNKGVKP